MTKFYLLNIILLILSSCNIFSEKKDMDVPDYNSPYYPILKPEESLKTMQIEKGLDIKLVASEPLINTPVALSFDGRGRIWVVEMTDFQPIQEDENHTEPTGRVVILEDNDGDGIMDDRKIFLDSLFMPRAITLVENGLLLATPPNLWFIEINENDRPGKKELVDSAYTITENHEGQTNGLIRAMDNWIYNAGFGSDKKYKRINGVWHIEPTILRGQWGITQDDFGHLFYDNNTTNLFGDFILPGMTSGKKDGSKIRGYHERIVSDRRVYPAIPTPGINRGYKAKNGELDDSLKLIHFTAGCGPVIYRGNLLPQRFKGNAFKCEPAANLIKRNILSYGSVRISGEQAYRENEFLRSTDERFRPVNLYNGPDGALYVVDMYRGVIEDRMFITDYLKNYAFDKGLNKPVNCGRIYKVVPKDSKKQSISIPENSEDLVELLADPNGWIRDFVQQKIIDEQRQDAVPYLKEMYHELSSLIPKIHILWTLEGLNQLDTGILQKELRNGDIEIKKHILNLYAESLNSENLSEYCKNVTELLENKDEELAPYLVYFSNKVAKFSLPKANKIRSQLLSQFPEDHYVVDAVIVGIQGDEKKYKEHFVHSVLFQKEISKIMTDQEDIVDDSKMNQLKKKYKRGYLTYQNTCRSCHGENGEGIEFVAPPLNQSDIVLGDKNILIPIILYGLTGPVRVNNVSYDEGSTVGEMPGFDFGQSTTKDLQEVINYVRQAWKNEASSISVNDIYEIRRKHKDRTKSFTIDELLK